MGDIHATDLLRFDAVSFGRHFDSQTSPAIGTLTVADTGGWQSWRTMTATITQTTGTHTVFLVFTSASTSNFVNVNRFDFSH